MNSQIRQTCSAATISLVFGILSWCVLPIIGAVIAIVSGHMARAEIRRANGALDGDGLAVGLILGYLHLAVIVLAIVAVFLFFGGLVAFVALAQHFGHH